jgi:crotonobetainyl-CoA:carnitine CoA-transferase CaiB-like acyl-CoA transferase
MTGALAGVRVLDLTRYVPGPFCTQLLGDLGADVVKVEEPPLGDPVRMVPPAVGDDGAAHAALNRNKRSVVVDLRKEEGALVVRRLAAGADVLVEAYRPGALARRGLGAETLCAGNPRLVYCSLTGYGQDGPLAGHAGHDLNYLALGGFLDGNRDADGRPVLPETQVADVVGGLVAAVGILAALRARETTGRGQVVDVSLLDGVLALLSVPLARRAAGHEGPGELSGTRPAYNVYACRDGRHLAVGALEPKFWEALCRALGLQDRIGRQWEGPQRARDTTAALARVFATRDRDDWVGALSAADACVEPVLGLDEVLEHPHARRSLVEQTDAAQPYRAVRCPVGLSASPAATRRPPPALGEHTSEVLAEAGYAREDVERLRALEVVA